MSSEHTHPYFELNNLNKLLITVLPALRSNPDSVVGIPVFLALDCFRLVNPIALFNENEKPNLPISDYAINDLTLAGIMYKCTELEFSL